MEDNLAHELEDNELQSTSINYPIEHPNEVEKKVNQIPQDIPISKGLTGFEKAISLVICTIVFTLVLLNISADFQLTKVNKDIQDVTTQIEQTEVEIENLKQHSHELSRYDRIYEIAEKHGLELHEENIKNIKPIE